MSGYWRWVLRDVTVDIEPGQAVGIVGTNGSGKSTLLKIFTRIMYPYAGRLEVSGRVGALIEIRAGIHPDLTGRENVHLYGSLMGMSRREVTERFDDIVAFAELEDAIDRRVKFYSRGMEARLGFAVASFMQPDILLVDEVLAVGDATFQHKCLDRMRKLLSEGTTLVYVSHDLATVEAMCSRGVWLHEGVTRTSGRIQDVLAGYREAVELAESIKPIDTPVRLVQSRVFQTDGTDPRAQRPLEVALTLESPTPQSGSICIGVSEGPAAPVFVLQREFHLRSGKNEVRCVIPHLPLPRGRFFLWAGMFEAGHRELLRWHPVAAFDITGPDLVPTPPGIVRLAPVHVEATWEMEPSS
jgi:ABC-type polysaccharide/polyol phosphate transport system ATPase subunit